MSTSSMNGSAYVSGSPIQFQRIIDDSTLQILMPVIKYALIPILGLLGVCANTLNVLVFAKMGFSDGVNQSFIILSVSDGLIAIASIVSSLCLILEDIALQNGSKSHLNSSNVAWSCSTANKMFQYVSMVTTVVITLVRCICVTMPLKAKQYTTPKHQMATTLGLLAPAGMVFIVTHLSARMIPFEIGPNNTVFVLRANNLKPYHAFMNIIFNSGVVVVVICVTVLSISLRMSRKFRKAMTIKEPTASSINDTSAKARHREYQVIKVVTIIAVIFIVCYLPQIALSSVNQFLDTLPPFGTYMNLAQFLVMVCEVSVLLNAGINLIFYLTYNSRFKESFKELFQIKR